MKQNPMPGAWQSKHGAEATEDSLAAQLKSSRTFNCELFTIASYFFARQNKNDN